MVPSVEGDAEGIGLEYPVNFAECRTDPTVAIVVMHGAPAAVPIPGEIRRIGDHEVNASIWQMSHHLDAVPRQDAVSRYWFPGFIRVP